MTTTRSKRSGLSVIHAMLLLSLASYLLCCGVVVFAAYANRKQATPQAFDVAPTTRQQHDARPEINHGGSVAVVQADIAVQYRFGGIR